MTETKNPARGAETNAKASAEVAVTAADLAALRAEMDALRAASAEATKRAEIAEAAAKANAKASGARQWMTKPLSTFAEMIPFTYYVAETFPEFGIDPENVTEADVRLVASLNKCYSAYQKAPNRFDYPRALRA